MHSRQKILIASLIGFIFMISLGIANRERIFPWLFQPTTSSLPVTDVEEQAVRVFASNLDTPWSITFMPNDDMLVTERNGQIKRIGSRGESYPIRGVRETSEGGLLGIALHPAFESNARLFIYFTTMQNYKLTNQIDEYSFKDDKLSFTRTVLGNIPAATNHNGGAIAFGPDRKLYVTTGDAAVPEYAQDKGSLAGKILRLNDDGSVPGDNPFRNFTWSYGHRNPQGITWDDEGTMWSVEHGPSGGSTGRDELNRIERGVNYGWPVITGDEKKQGMQSPVAQSGDNETWAPAGIVYSDDALYFTGLRGRSLYKAEIDNGTATLTRFFSGMYGRLRAISTHGGNLYLGTSNRDGRGAPIETDDRILQISLTQL